MLKTHELRVKYRPRVNLALVQYVSKYVLNYMCNIFFSISEILGFDKFHDQRKDGRRTITIFRKILKTVLSENESTSENP